MTTEMTHVKDRLEGRLSVNVPSIVALPDAVGVKDFVVGQHVDGVEDVLTLRHSQIMGHQHEATSILFRTNQHDN